jgi:hypothetical protein
MLQDLTLQQKHLAETMSDISERCYFAGWMLHLEYVLWNAIETGPRPYGLGEITEEDIGHLKSLAELTGCWIIFHDEFEEMAIDLSSWKAVYQAEIARDIQIINW